MSKRLEESQIIELLKLGDPAAVEYWFSEYENRMTHFFSQRIESTQDVHELVQETFVACLKQLPLFRGESSIYTWMISIAQHQVADFYRKKYAKKALQYLPLSQFLLDTKIDDAHETAEKVKQVLTKMSTSSCELLQKKYVDGKKVAEIAIELGKSVKSIESELFRARIEFKELYLAK
jgi:RNA polymerase sigma-70 factor (ECF subfamily)